MVASTDHHAFREAMLVTHRGLSGPAILQISSYWNNGEPLRIDLAPDREVFASLRSSINKKYRRRTRCTATRVAESIRNMLA